MRTAIVDTGPPGSRATPLPTRGAGIGARPSTRYSRGESNRSPRGTQRCRATLHRVGNLTFASRTDLEDGEPVRVRVVWSKQELKFDLCFLDRLAWASTVLRPAGNPDFIGQLLFENRRYQLGATLVHGVRLRVELYMRPLHLYRAIDQQAQLEEVK